MPTSKTPVSKKQPRKATKRAAVYARISRDGNGGGDGVDRQLKDLRKFCKREGWTVTEFLDNDISASRYSKKLRPQFLEMMAAVARGDIDVIAVAELSRFTREPRMIEYLIDAADSGTVELVSLQGGNYDAMTAPGRLRLRNEAAFGAAYSDFISEKVRRAK